MAEVEFQDFTIRVTEAMNEALIAALHEAAGELQARTVRNSRQGHKYGGKDATALWDSKVDESKMEAYVGSEHEAAYWEEFGTGEFALHHDGRKGWWIYIEGKENGKGGKTYSSKEEAEEAAALLRRVSKANVYVTNGMEPNRPLHRAFESGKSTVEHIFAEKLKGL